MLHHAKHHVQGAVEEFWKLNSLWMHMQQPQSSLINDDQPAKQPEWILAATYTRTQSPHAMGVNMADTPI
jgi:hypothetical protein